MYEPKSELTEEDRWDLLRNLSAMVELPLQILGLLWLALLVLDLTTGLGDVAVLSLYAIWIVFILDFLLRFLIAPRKKQFILSNWLGLIGLSVPALRVLAIFRAARIVQSIRFIRAARLARVLTSTSRALTSVRLFLGQRQLGLVLASTAAVTLAGAAGIYGLEGEPASEESGIRSFPDALWWSAMMITSVGSDYWPVTWEGRVLAWMMAVYALGIFGYVAAYLASTFLKSPQAHP